MAETILQKIAAHTAERIAREKATVPQRALEARLSRAAAPRDFTAPFVEGDLAVIAEIKRKSPSAGALALEANPVQVAGEYLRAGAAAISVVTEPEFFHGSLEFLAEIRRAYPESRLLMKDFILEEYQILQGRLSGADAILLIVALLDENTLVRLHAFARALGLEALVEVHDAEELKRALACGARLIGVNNRNLKTMEVSLEVSRSLAARVPADRLLIAESGLESGRQLRELAALGFRGFLIGTSLMRTHTPGKALEKLLEEAAAPASSDGGSEVACE